MKKLTIPQELPQFEKEPALFIVSGEYEAFFYLAHQKQIEQKEHFQFMPRRDAKGKDEFVGVSQSPHRYGSSSHKEYYLKDLKNKFHKKLKTKLKDLASKLKFEKIYLFAPDYVKKQIEKDIKNVFHQKVKIQKSIAGEYTKQSPIEVLEILQKIKDEEKPHLVFSEAEKKIMSQPRIKP